jgi:3-deoxy-D-manno-octulosonic acid kinase
MLYDASRVSNASAEIFEPEYWQSRRAVSRALAGRGLTLFIDYGGRHWVLRHYHRGGRVAALLGDRYLWTGESRARPMREWRLMSELRAEGLPVPAPVAARYVREGLFYRGDLITERIIDALPLSGWLDRGGVALTHWRAVGACIRHFHERGVCHADLNAHNILLDKAGAVSLIDFDRGTRREHGEWQQKNLARLRRSLVKIGKALPRGRFGEPEWHALSQGYASGE